jgi:hypothetical protein
VPSPAPPARAGPNASGALRPGALTRHSELKRTTPLARTSALTPSGPPKRRRRRLSAKERREKQRFQAHAQDQQRCANCNSRGAWHAHHAGVYEQKLRHLGLPLWEPANALRLCLDCHAKHHTPRQKLKLKVLRAENIRYAFQTLGECAYDYLRARYSGNDPRIERELARARSATTRSPQLLTERCAPERQSNPEGSECVTTSAA